MRKNRKFTPVLTRQRYHKNFTRPESFRC